MKTMLCGVVLMWISLALELAWSSRLPPGSLLLPVACGVMFWSRSASGLIISGLLLLLDWVARPSQLPLCPMLLPLLAVLCLAASDERDEYRPRGFAIRLPAALQLPFLTLAAVLLRILGSISYALFVTPSLILSEIRDPLTSLLIIALPLSAGMSLMIRLADEFGLRRSFAPD